MTNNNNNFDHALLKDAMTEVATAGIKEAVATGNRLIDDGVFDDQPELLELFRGALEKLEAMRYDLDQQVT